MTTPHIVVRTANNVSYVILVDVSDISGVLEGIGVSGGEFHHYVKVTLDRRTLADDVICGSNANYENTGLALHLPFNNRLLIEVRDDPMATMLPRFWASYITSSSKLVDEKKEFEEVKGVNYVYKVATFESPEGKRYTVKSLEGCNRVSKVSLDADVYVRQTSKSIKGRVELKDWQGKPLHAEAVPLIVRPIGRMFKVAVFPIGKVEGEKAFEIEPKPELPLGNFLLQSDLAGWANIPAGLTVL